MFLGHTVTYTFSFTTHSNLFLLAVQFSYQGVAIFFLISGFLLYRPFLVARQRGRPYSIPTFGRRRILRIVPAYWVALSIFLLLGFVTGISPHNWWIFYGFGQTYDAGTISQGIGVAWTLCIEVTFYAALPLLAWAASRLGRDRSSVAGDVVLLVGLSAASLAFRAHFHSFADFPEVSTLAGTFTWFALGMGLAVLSVRDAGQGGGSSLGRFVTRRPTELWALAIGGFVLFYFLLRGPPTVLAALTEHLLYGVVALLVLLPGIFGERPRGLPTRILRLRVLAWIGLTSYSFYLYHTIVLAQLNTLVSDLHGLPRYLFVLVFGVALSCACAGISYYVVERPMLRLGRPRARSTSKGTPGGDTPSPEAPAASQKA